MTITINGANAGKFTRMYLNSVLKWCHQSLLFLDTFHILIDKIKAILSFNLHILLYFWFFSVFQEWRTAITFSRADFNGQSKTIHICWLRLIIYLRLHVHNFYLIVLLNVTALCILYATASNIARIWGGPQESFIGFSSCLHTRVGWRLQ